MKQVLIGLVTADVLVLSAAAVIGFLAQGERLFVYHFALGLFGAIYTVLMHVVVYIYFIVSGKIVAEAVQRAGVGGRLEQRARQLKSRAFRIALVGIALIIAAALLGGRIASVALGSDGLPDEARRSAALTLHMLVALAALAAQPIVASVHYHFVGEQMSLNQEAMAALETVRRIRAAQRLSASDAERGARDLSEPRP